VSCTPAAIACGRFAPSTTGPAHPGTLLAGLLCWLDARSQGGRVILRLEDLDPERSRPEWGLGLRHDLAWLGLRFDAVERQSEVPERYAAALDRLAQAGRLYPCRCSRTILQALGERTPDGSFRYPGCCRTRPLPTAGWRECQEPLRAHIDPGEIAIRDESGLDLSQDPAAVFGDPVVRRRDGAVAYHLASVVDDAAAGVTRVVRGRDLAASTATQVALQRCLGLAAPHYRHHLLLLEARGDKLAKLHGAVDLEALRARYTAAELCGWLAWAAGLLPAVLPTSPAGLLRSFAWSSVRTADQQVRWTGRRLLLGDARRRGRSET